MKLKAALCEEEGQLCGLLKPQQRNEASRREETEKKQRRNGTKDYSKMANTNLPPGGLNSLYNTGVQSAEWVTRPKQWVPTWVPNMYPTTHSGVRVTLDDGQKFLIHKGPGFGQASETVITDANHMSHKWEVKESQDVRGARTVGDFVKSGGTNYSLLKGQHCHRAAHDMMNHHRAAHDMMNQGKK